MEFVDLSRFSELEILNTHNKAFSDYEVPMQLSLESFKYFNQRRGVRYDLSFGAVEENELVGFILNAIDNWEGKSSPVSISNRMTPAVKISER